MAEQTTTTHGSFTIERKYPQSIERVYRAFSDPQRKKKWFAEGKGFELETFEMDFRVGGGEYSRFKARHEPVAGWVFTNRTTYFDIVDGKRIVLCYSMANGDKVFSVSLLTVELSPIEAGGTNVILTEQGAFFEGADGLQIREAGYNGLLASLGAFLDAETE
jgi:uncharacterized protein YndB with AHSA1/START domain